MAYLENDFISPIIYTWQWLTYKMTSLAQLIYTRPLLTKKTTSLAQLFIDDHGLLRKRLH